MTMDVSDGMMKSGLKMAIDYIGKDPDVNMGRLMDWVDRIAGEGPESCEPQRKVFRRILEEPDSSMYRLLKNLWTDIDGRVLKTIFENYVLNAKLTGRQQREHLGRRYECSIPQVILIEPTSACNLRCSGCGMSRYGSRRDLSFDELDYFICQGKELGVYTYIYAGREPLMRKYDLIALCRKHHDCQFLVCTNATLLNEEFAEKMLELKNLIPVIRLDGFEEEMEGRYGKGTFAKIVEAMEILKKKRLLFGIHVCYTGGNMEFVSSDSYIGQIMEWGAKFVWYFPYMPVGKSAAGAQAVGEQPQTISGRQAVPGEPQTVSGRQTVREKLQPTGEQRGFMHQRVRGLRRTYPIFAIDFQSGGKYADNCSGGGEYADDCSGDVKQTDGCFGDGRRYLHINADGDAGPCTSLHYPELNIRRQSLLEILQSPVFTA
ncbi:radical SAM domain protein [Marvinbryantia formatexigens DSM 14469]|uniref:Radical SAM domain protein n=2 Tax=Marvinbryantia TaxID=248744 RepID=C6LE77_9FIRM|nr:radical SAM domain protein [Marvinbryantia formatexigens DSM 14469]